LRLLRKSQSRKNLGNRGVASARAVGRQALRCAAVGALVAMGLGCDVKSFIDPSELGRFERTPLTLQILNSLDTGVEEPASDFLNWENPTPDDLIVEQVDYRMDRGDLVSVSISDLQAQGVDTVRTVRVSESGNVSLPYIGQMKALGLTEAELEADIIRAYADAALIKDAQVAVTVAEARGRAFSVLGAVGRPDQYVIVRSDFRVLDALVLAQDTTTPTIEYLYILRKRSGDATTTAPATAPGPGSAVEPSTGPAPDVLEPRVDRHAPARRNTAQARLAAISPAVMLQTTSEAVANQPATLPGDAPGGRMVEIDGKPVLIPGADVDAVPSDPGTTQPGAVVETLPGDAGPTTAEAVTAVPTTQPFEFDAPPDVADMRVIRIPLAQLRNGDFKYNIVIKPRDMIVVPQPTVGEFYMGGHVARVGVYSLTGRKITLKQAVVSAGMLDQLAIPQRTDIIRRVGPDKEVFARVDLAKIFEGSQPDIFLKPDDVVQVGTNFFAPFLAALRGGFRVTYGFGFLYDRNYAPDENNN
jgi:polysaccharide export outer membrane protein